MALTTALAMILSFVESQIPAFVAVPGVKMGLANIAVVFALYKLGWKEAAAISLVRVVLVSLLFGSIASLFYSFAGAVLSLLGMGLLGLALFLGHVGRGGVLVLLVACGATGRAYRDARGLLARWLAACSRAPAGGIDLTSGLFLGRHVLGLGLGCVASHLVQGTVVVHAAGGHEAGPFET